MNCKQNNKKKNGMKCFIMCFYMWGATTHHQNSFSATLPKDVLSASVLMKEMVGMLSGLRCVNASAKDLHHFHPSSQSSYTVKGGGVIQGESTSLKTEKKKRKYKNRHISNLYLLIVPLLFFGVTLAPSRGSIKFLFHVQCNIMIDCPSYSFKRFLLLHS